MCRKDAMDAEKNEKIFTQKKLCALCVFTVKIKFL
jgi:hypothetical protein